MELQRRDRMVRGERVLAAGHGRRAHRRQHGDVLGVRRRGPQQGQVGAGGAARARACASRAPAPRRAPCRQHQRHRGNTYTPYPNHSEINPEDFILNRDY